MRTNSRTMPANDTQTTSSMEMLNKGMAAMNAKTPEATKPAIKALGISSSALSWNLARYSPACHRKISRIARPRMS